MKRIFALMLCIIIVCAMPLMVFAEEDALSSGNLVSEGENLTIESEMPDLNTAQKTVAEKILDWAKPRIEEISVIITLLMTIFYNVLKHKVLNKSIGVLNNNAVAIAENSSRAIDGVSSAVVGYSDDIKALLEEYRKTAEENKKLAAALENAQVYLQSAKDANVEFSNELAELLILANIPNFKKEEIYTRHRAAVDAIAGKPEVIENDREEA